MTEELKLLWKCKKVGGGGGEVQVRSGRRGQGECDQRIEGIVKMQKSKGRGPVGWVIVKMLGGARSGGGGPVGGSGWMCTKN